MKAATLGSLARRDRDLERRALPLDVVDHGDGLYSVASATMPGESYRVVATVRPWQCSCIGGGATDWCSHRRAVRRYQGQHGQAHRSGAT